jgi:hypothetical protein
LGVFGFIFVFRLNPIFFFLALIVFLFLLGTPDKVLLSAAAVGLLVMLMVTIRDRAWVLSLWSSAKESFLSPVSLGVLGGAAGVLAFAFRNLSQPRVARASLLFFLVGGTAYSSGGTLLHMAQVARSSQSLNDSLSAFEKLRGSAVTILGPSYLWYGNPDELRDIGGIIFDRYYSGVSRPRECIDRVRPDLLVIGNDFVRRYMTEKDSSSGQWKMKPFESVVSAPAEFIGSLPESSQHERQDVFRLHWDDHRP